MFRLMLVSIFLVLPISCNSDKKKDEDKDSATEVAEAGADAAAKAAEGADAGAAGKGEGVGSSDDYDPTKGDKATFKSNSKAWASGETEPGEWTESERNDEVVGIYASGAPCKYRMKRDFAGQETTSDMRCETLSCGGESDCDEEDVEDEDVGDFKQASGKKYVCTSTVDLPTGKMVIRSETSSWTHADALTEGRVVKAETYTCSATFADGEDASADPCKEKDGVTIQFSKSENILTVQEKGKGGDELTKWASAKFKTGGAVAEPDKSSFSPAACTALDIPQLGKKLSITLSRNVCKNDAPAADFMAISQLVLKTGKQSTGLGGASITSGVTSYLGADQGCEVDLSVADGFVSGTAACTEDFTEFGTSNKAQVTDIEFSCPLPENVNADEFVDGGGDGDGNGGGGDTGGTGGNGGGDTGGNGGGGDTGGNGGGGDTGGNGGGDTGGNGGGDTGGNGGGDTGGNGGGDTGGNGGGDTGGNGGGEQGRWYAVNGAHCHNYCIGIGKTNRRSLDGGNRLYGSKCVSGEVKTPSSFEPMIPRPQGCWPACNPSIYWKHADSYGNKCYGYRWDTGAAQNQDNDVTDKTVGCYCE